MEATDQSTIESTTKEIVNPYEKPLLNWDPNGIKKVITAGMLKSPPTGLAMPQALYCIVDYINGNSPLCLAI